MSRRANILFGALVGVPIAVILGLVILLNVPMTPSLSPARAATILSASPDFEHPPGLIEVSSTARAPGSLKDSMYFVELKCNRPGSSLAGHAAFEYNGSDWHFQYVRWDP